MQMLVDRKLKNNIAENLIYRNQTKFLRSFLGLQNCNFENDSGSFQNHSRKLPGDVGCHLCEFFARKPG